MKKISILGSTGSIGTQALDICRENGFEVVGLSANRNADLLIDQAREFCPKYIAVNDEAAFNKLKAALLDTDIKILFGIDGICHIASLPENDIVLNSVVGMIGLRPTLAAIEAGKDIALANKETLVVGGELVMRRAMQMGVKILPVDSEHSAIFQCICANSSKKPPKRLILTASGGPFFGKSKGDLVAVTAADALRHPNWSMGAKITVDSATMMNKGFELIEAKWLFNMHPEDIEVVVHRQSVVHSLVEFEDSSVLAQLGVPDMKIPIQYALTYPEREPSSVKRLDLTQYATLSFNRPDDITFPAVNICREAIKRGGLAPCAVNSANEEAVALFLEDRISFLDIPELAREAMENCPNIKEFSVEDILKTEAVTRAWVRAACK